MQPIDKQPLDQDLGQDRSVSIDTEVHPSIGCYVKEEYAAEYKVRSGGPASPHSKKNYKWPLTLLLAVIVIFSLGIGFFRHSSKDLRLLSEAQSFAQRVYAQIKFPIEQLHIVGHQYTKEKEIVTSLGDIWDHSLISLNTIDAQKRIEKLPWVKQAVVERVFPHGLNVYVTERQPIGRWVTLSGRFVFDAEGFVISQIKVGEHLDLPIYEGSAAPRGAHELRQALMNFDDLGSFFVRYRRVDQRRWTLILKDGMEVWLPAKQFTRALSRLRALQVQHNILSRQLSVIDLRLEDRVSLRPKRGHKVKVLSTLEDPETNSKIKIDSILSSKERL